MVERGKINCNHIILLVLLHNDGSSNAWLCMFVSWGTYGSELLYELLAGDLK